ncbi:MAG: fumarylacetoacetate hydrolase family protein [Methanocella sp.]
MKIVCIGLNYRDHAAEMGLAIPDEPIFFLKPDTALIGPEEPIVYPAMTREVGYEAELAVLIGREAKGVSVADAPRYIAGYTCFNDVTARDLQRKDGQWTRAKSFDTFAPCGREIAHGIDPSDLTVECYVNGERKQSSTTRNLIFPVPFLVSFLSQVMTLHAGDLVATGTPGGIGLLRPGDVVEVVIGQVGRLRNPVVLAPGAAGPRD